MPTSRLPPIPDFEAIEVAAQDHADRQTTILALIGNLGLSWSNNESLFVYVLMCLMDSDEISAAIVFATLNTTRARLDLVQRLAAAKIGDKDIAGTLAKLIKRFNACTKTRNELNHATFTLDEHGDITHTYAMRVQEGGGRLRFGEKRPMDNKRIEELLATIRELKELNRDLWAFLPRLEAHIAERRTRGDAKSTDANDG